MDDAVSEATYPWAHSGVARALDAAVPGFMPPESLALYARWWQLEGWLRELAYVELRATHGLNWTQPVAAASGRQSKDAQYTHMAASDNDNPLAYMDYSQLLDLIATDWPRFAYALIEQDSWNGRQQELMRIRHRIGHMRRPHEDDLGRLEQTLRDLERGAFIALASYNRRRAPDPKVHLDPVTEGWIRHKHPAASRLVQHADSRYDTQFRLELSRRPWLSSWPGDLANAEGVLWHAHYFLRGRMVDAVDLWHDTALDVVRPLLVHMLVDEPYSVECTFSAVDDPDDISDAIGVVFDALLRASHVDDGIPGNRDRLVRRLRNVDFRLLHMTGWNIIDETTIPVSNFGAGGGMQSVPNW